MPFAKTAKTDVLDKLVAAFLRRANDGTLARLLVEISVVPASRRSNGANTPLRGCGGYKVNTDAITTNVKQ
jgi:ParB family transcriptional regulator, chromosome partitioning protein